MNKEDISTGVEKAETARKGIRAFVAANPQTSVAIFVAVLALVVYALI